MNRLVHELPNDSQVIRVFGEVRLRRVDDFQVPVLVDGSDLLDDELAGGFGGWGLWRRAVAFAARPRLLLMLCGEFVQLCHFLCRKQDRYFVIH